MHVWGNEKHSLLSFEKEVGFMCCPHISYAEKSSCFVTFAKSNSSYLGAIPWGNREGEKTQPTFGRGIFSTSKAA